MFGIDDLLMGGLAVGGLVSKLFGGFGADDAQKEAQHAQQAMQNVQAQRERTKSIREARIKRAEIVQSANDQGAEMSSSAVTGASTVNTQNFANQEAITQQVSLGKNMSKYQQNFQNAQGLSALGGGLFDMAGTLFKNRTDIKDLFS